ncbi:acyltransferase domain-containing protein [Lentzea sp. CC55]|uniref:acyltransferase domain-containing protein n=1 Tax=Lentzea sp. CC55 TaxID=2884909 RepID=UPI001F2F9121|nr:acyltransferase domain-containing protein [Lentzea sp. CC55]MCG8927696.1 acyltransferase domain-containing protein [Lentzea sp. CC55]
MPTSAGWRTAFCFSGAGAVFADPFAYYPVGRGIAAGIARRIDAVSSDYGWPSVLTGPDLASWSPLLELQTYHAQLACYQVLLNEFEVRPDVLLGHSLGEITALVAADGLAVEDGAILLCERAVALAAHADDDAATAAFMVSPQEGKAFAEQAEGVSVAAVNSPAQVVLSGPADQMMRLGDLAVARGVTVTPLRAGPYAQHHPALKPAFERYLQSVRGIQAAPLRTAVWSPVLARALEPEDDLVLLAALQMVRPLDFHGAVAGLWSAGVGQFVECGLKDTSTRLVTAALGDRARVFAPFRKRSAEAGIRQITAHLTSHEEHAMTDSNDDMIGYLRENYAAALEIPEEMVTPDVDLEAEFGLDSLQHRLVLVKAAERWSVDLGRAESPATITVRSVAGMVRDAGAAGQA